MTHTMIYFDLFIFQLSYFLFDIYSILNMMRALYVNRWINQVHNELYRCSKRKLPNNYLPHLRVIMWQNSDSNIPFKEMAICSKNRNIILQHNSILIVIISFHHITVSFPLEFPSSVQNKSINAYMALNFI